MANRILLADDSITIQKVVNLTFADEGIEVVAVSNGEMAERRLSEINPDLVLADIFMPGKNGYELCQYIKGNPHFRHVPVVLLVGAFEPFDQAEARRVQADAHLTKPFESRTLVETVRRLIETSRLPAAGFGAPPVKAKEAATEPEPAPAEFQGFSLEAPAPEEWSSQQQAAVQQPASQDEGFAFTGPAAAVEEQPSSFSALSASSETPEQPAVADATPPADDAGFSGFEVSLTSGAPSVGFELGNLQPEEVATQDAPVESFSFAESLGKTAPSGSPAGAVIPSAFGQQSKDFVIDFEKVEAPESSFTGASLESDSPAPVANEQTVEFHPAEAASAPEPTATLSSPSAEESVQAGEISAGGPSLDFSTGFEFPSSEPIEPIAAETTTGTVPAEPQEASHRDFGFSFEVSQPTQNAEPVPTPEPTTDVEPASVFSKFNWADVKSDSADAFELAHADTAPLPKDIPVLAEASQTQPQADTGFSLEVVSELGDIDEPISSQVVAGADEHHEGAEAGESAFTAADMWSQHPQYAPMDVEPLAVGQVADAPIPADTRDAAAGYGAFEVSDARKTEPELETGFEVAQIIAEEAGFAIVESTFTERTPRQPAGDSADGGSQLGLSAVHPDRLAAALRVEPAEPILAHEREPQPPISVVSPVPVVVGSSSAAASADLPAPVMDEIVRRVVAQISDSVIREIAWEVVPDIVERVIDRVARESALRKTGT
jgi:CheY-like chemotaxis protein